MKKTELEKLARRFPEKPDDMGYGQSPDGAKISPAHLQLLLNAGLIKPDSRNNIGTTKDGTGWKRRHTFYTRTFK